MNRHPLLKFLATGAVALLVCTPSFGAESLPVNPGTLAPKLQSFVDNKVMAGAVVLVADGQKVIDLEAVGFSDLKEQKPMRVDDLFWIASMTKPITAAAVMILVDEGRVKVDDPVEKYIPEFKELKVTQADGTLISPSHPILIRELLSHTSGMRFLNGKGGYRIDSVPLKDSIQNDLLEPLMSDPGTQYRYSNEGIDTAGRIIEIVTGMPYERFLQDRLFTPLGMTDTTFNPNAQQLEKLAKTYQINASKDGLAETTIGYLTNPLDNPARYPAPGGGLFSTARDVCRFCQMLLNGGILEGKRYLSEASVHQMTIKQTGPQVSERYGFGLDASDGNTYGHSGAYKTKLCIDRGQIRVFLAQHASGWATGDPNNTFDTEAVRIYPPKPATAKSDAVGSPK